LNLETDELAKKGNQPHGQDAVPEKAARDVNVAENEHRQIEEDVKMSRVEPACLVIEERRDTEESPGDETVRNTDRLQGHGLNQRADGNQAAVPEDRINEGGFFFGHALSFRKRRSRGKVAAGGRLHSRRRHV